MRTTTWPFAVLTVSFVLIFSALGLARTWTDSDGKTICEGEYAGVDAGKVHILTGDGDLKTVPLADLSVGDRKYIVERLRAKGGRGISVEPMAGDEDARRWAFLVGVDDYLGEKWDLDYCVADIAALRDRLDEIGFQAASTVYLTTTGREIGTVPTKANIEREFKGMLDKVKKDDVVIVAFSGHGTNLDNQNYFCPANMDPTNKQSLLKTMVSLDRIYEQLTNSPARFQLLLVDACRNNPLGSGTKSIASAKSLGGFSKSLDEAPASLVAMRSCLPEEESHEHAKLGHGVFMYHVLEGLRGRADRENGNRNGRVSLMELCAYTREATSTFVRTECGKRQTPTIEVHKEFHDFDLVDSKMLDVVVQFTVRLEKQDGSTLRDIPVALARHNRWNQKTTVLAESKTDQLGKVDLTIPYENLESTGSGDFHALVSCLGNVKRIPLPGFPKSHPGDLVVDLPEDFTNSIGMKLKLIPAGEFLMGSPESDEDAGDSENPQHRVRITKPFYLGVTEVTQGQWEAVMGTRPWSGETYVKEGSDYAASYVDWQDAWEFCKKLSSKEGVPYRLPTEAEWEYACRGETTTVYHFGDDASRLGDYAWFEDNAYDVDEKYAHRVGQKKANAYGLHDMHGNVREWCADQYDSDYYENSPTDDPTGPTTGSNRVHRGGSWSNGPRRCRSADRFTGSPLWRYHRDGFRVASVPVDASGR